MIQVRGGGPCGPYVLQETETGRTIAPGSNYYGSVPNTVDVASTHSLPGPDSKVVYDYLTTLPPGEEWWSENQPPLPAAVSTAAERLIRAADWVVLHNTTDAVQGVNCPYTGTDPDKMFGGLED